MCEVLFFEVDPRSRILGPRVNAHVLLDDLRYSYPNSLWWRVPTT